MLASAKHPTNSWGNTLNNTHRQIRASCKMRTPTPKKKHLMGIIHCSCCCVWDDHIGLCSTPHHDYDSSPQLSWAGHNFSKPAFVVDLPVKFFFHVMWGWIYKTVVWKVHVGHVLLMTTIHGNTPTEVTEVTRLDNKQPTVSAARAL